MVQLGDVELTGQPYMVVPESYRRMADGPPEGRTGRIVINDFVGGQRRALQLERESSWDAAGVGPAFFGQGIEPWPFTATHVDGTIQPVSSAQRVHGIVVGNHAYLGAGRCLYRSVALNAGSWVDLTQVADLGAGRAITGLAYDGGQIAIATGNGLDIQRFNPATLALSTITSGFKGGWITGYASRLIASDPTPGNEGVLQLTTGGGIDRRQLDSPITNMTLHAGRVAISTRTGIWLLGGRSDPDEGVWIGEPEPLFSHGSYAEGEDFNFLASFGGKLYTWLAGQVMEWNPNAGASRQGWRTAGVEGRACFGGTVAGNMLVVSIQNRAGAFELWAFDGTGWWLMRSSSSSARVWPAYVAGAGAIDLIAFRNADAAVAYDLYRMVYRDAVNHAYAQSGSFVTSLLDAGERDAEKSWRALGAVFAAPTIRGNPASTDPVSVTLFFSLDAGATWTVADSATVSDPTALTLALQADLDGGSAASRFIQLRLTYSSVADWAPVMTGLWVEYLLLDRPAKRRRWTMRLASCCAMARLPLIRAGSRSPHSGPPGRPVRRSRSVISTSTMRRSRGRSASPSSPRRLPNLPMRAAGARASSTSR
jgi:hypothetical protein